MRSLVPLFRNLSAFFLFIQGFWAYSFPGDYCPYGGLREINEDIREIISCTGTGDTVKWIMSFYNGSQRWSEDVATCDRASCTNLLPDRYWATRRDSTSSVLEILNTDRASVGNTIGCQSQTGDQRTSCKLRLKYLSRPTDCQLTVNNAERRVSGSCVTNKFYLSDGQEDCWFYHRFGDQPEIAHQGKLSVGTIIDPINGRLYLNGTCSFSAYLTQCDGLYTFTMFVNPGLRRTDVGVIHLDTTPTQPPTTTSTTTLINTISGTESADDRGIMYGLIVLGIAAIIITAIIVGFLVWRQVRGNRLAHTQRKRTLSSSVVAASSEAPQEPRTGLPPSTKQPFPMGTLSIPAIEETAHPTGDRSTLVVINVSDGTVDSGGYDIPRLPDSL